MNADHRTDAQGRIDFMRYTLNSVVKTYPPYLRNKSFAVALRVSRSEISKLEKSAVSIETEKFMSVEFRFCSFLRSLVKHIGASGSGVENIARVARLYLGGFSLDVIDWYDERPPNFYMHVMDCLKQIAADLDVDEDVHIGDNLFEIIVAENATGMLASGDNPCQSLLEFMSSNANCMIMDMGYQENGVRGQGHENALFIQKTSKREVSVTHFDPHGLKAAYADRTRLVVENVMKACGINVAHYTGPREPTTRNSKHINPQKESQVRSHINEMFPGYEMEAFGFEGLCSLYVALAMLQVIAAYAVRGEHVPFVADVIKNLYSMPPHPGDIAGMAGLLYQAVHSASNKTVTNVDHSTRPAPGPDRNTLKRNTTRRLELRDFWKSHEKEEPQFSAGPILPGAFHEKPPRPMDGKRLIDEYGKWL